jgi:hypothetical protein
VKSPELGFWVKACTGVLVVKESLEKTRKSKQSDSHVKPFKSMEVGHRQDFTRESLAFRADEQRPPPDARLKASHQGAVPDQAHGQAFDVKGFAG